MRILAIADVHRNEVYIDMFREMLARENPDAVVAAGDIAYYHREADLFLGAIEARGVPFLFVSGNHERDVLLRDRLRRNQKAVWLDEQVTVLNGVVFLGLGYAEAACIGRSRGIKIRPRLSALARRLGKLAPDIRNNAPRVLVTHEPPQVWHRDGNPFIDRFAVQHGIRTVICGHIHVKQPSVLETEHFRVINPGPLGIMVEV